jgi:hypothetical protein
MAEKKTYPPAYIKPGDITKLNAQDGEMEFIGVYDDKVIAFLAAYYEWQALTQAPMQPSDATIQHANRKMAITFNRLDGYTVKKIMEKADGTGRIWTPEGGGDNVG